MKCSFCTIDPVRNPILKNGEYSNVFLSNFRLMPGHILIVPKRHVEKISELNKGEREEIFTMLIEYQEKILDKISNGCDLRQHYRPFEE